MTEFIARQGEMFANRLVKSAKKADRWAHRKKITSYRIYDRDIPEIPVSVDRYGQFIHVSVYARTRLRDHEEEWIEMIRNKISDILVIAPTKIHIKTRKRQKGSAQYERLNGPRIEHQAIESGLRFIINLTNYLDTGLFLDHRKTRKLVRKEAKGKKFLNLFSYTGSFSVFAAAGGARSSLTVDMSNTYCAWSERNLTLNGFTRPEHRVMRADVLEFLSGKPREPFDLIVVDPPSFSNSKKMRQSFDVQRDHRDLLSRVVEWGKIGSVVYFSNNRKGFKLDDVSDLFSQIEDLTRQTTTEDFRRHPAHKCWRMTI